MSDGDLPSFDLQSHSTHSDGDLPPEAVVRMAADAGVELLALTDHDTVDGVDEALEAGERFGVRVIPAVELTAVHETYEDLHILGYGLDHRGPALRAQLESFRDDRVLRAQRMADRLRELGFGVEDAALDARRDAGKPVGRPHLAAAVLSHPENEGRLRDEGIGDVSDMIRAYLVAGASAYLPRTRPTVPEAIELLHAAGGVAVWAHPFWDVSDTPTVLAMVDRFADDGIDGVEAFYVTHTEEQTRALVEHCRRRGLATTGSADFHGPEHRLFHRFRAFDLHGAQATLDRLDRAGA